MSDMSRLIAAFEEIIEGRTVKRSKHDLVYRGTDHTHLFRSALNRLRFLPATVGEVKIEPGQRVPAFHLENQTAYFGWVFWEKFTELRLRKLFGTVVRNAKGDWLIQLPSNSATTIYVNTTVFFDMDIDRPTEL